MTREEAISIAYYGIHPEEVGKLYAYDKHRDAGMFVEMLEKLGLLKLDEPTVLCKEDEDWNWWLLQPKEFKASTVRYLRKFIERR